MAALCNSRQSIEQIIPRALRKILEVSQGRFHPAYRARVSYHLPNGDKFATICQKRRAAVLGHVKRWRPAVLAMLPSPEPEARYRRRATTRRISAAIGV